MNKKAGPFTLRVQLMYIVPWSPQKEMTVLFANLLASSLSRTRSSCESM